MNETKNSDLQKTEDFYGMNISFLLNDGFTELEHSIWSFQSFHLYLI